MCVILINKGKKVDYFNFREMYLANEDGIGFMYHDIESKKVITQKIVIDENLGVLEFHDKLESVYRAYEMVYDDPKYTNLIVHFRNATKGDINLQNCHPIGYVDSNDVQCYLMHNGHIHAYANGFQRTDLNFRPSDTYNFAKDFLQGKNWSIKEIVEEAERHQKIVILKDGDLKVYADTHYFVEVDNDGNLYSNDFWVPEGGG